MRSQVLAETPSRAEASCPLSLQCSTTFLTARSPAGVSLSRSASVANVCGMDDATVSGIVALRALAISGLHQLVQNIASSDVTSSPRKGIPTRLHASPGKVDDRQIHRQEPFQLRLVR